jgi:glutathione S-transferase
MILIGQYDSPFARRVAIALKLYGFEYDHRPWSVWADADRIAPINPLRRVPTLLLDDGEVLIESSAILDSLDEMVGAERAILPRAGPERRRGLRVCALASGLADKAVSLFYETLLHEAPSPTWTLRCRTQIGDVFTALEADCARSASTWWLGERIGHPDIAVGCALRFVREAHPGLFDPSRWPRLATHGETCEALEAFRAISQPLTVMMTEEEEA